MNNTFTALKNQLSPIFVKNYTKDVEFKSAGIFAISCFVSKL